ncbi:MAG: Conserved repeat protein/Por secretion system C-terminal sorting [Hymenobacter sp.]|nr:Conserved repeat protein/Por secretion system C-terminal sorting [Hymenobacter sp.]
MLRHCYLLVLFLLIAGTGPLRAQSFAWAKLARGAVDTSFVRPQTSATDAAGNTYLAVDFSDSLRAGNILLTGPRTNSMALLKYDSTGAVLFAKLLGNVRVTKMAADNSADGIFLIAINRGSGRWDGTAVPASAGTRFYAKCSAAGALQWANPLPQSAGGNESVVSDNAGNAYFSSTVYTNGTVGGVAVNTSENFVLKTDGAGTTQWVKVLHSNSTSPFYNLLLGPKPGGGCLATGTLVNSPLYLGSGTATPVLTLPNQTSSFITSFDAAGNHQWSQAVGSSTNMQTYANIQAVAAGPTGDIYATGQVYGNAVLVGTTTLTSGFFLVKFDAAGALQWVRAPQSATPNTSGSNGSLLAVTNTGPTVVVNIYSGSLTLGTLVLRGTYNFVHYSALGVPQWTVTDGGTNPNPGATAPYFGPGMLGSDARGNLYTVGIPVYSVAASPTPTIQLGAQTTVGKGAIVARLNAYANTLRGQVYFDQNGNGVQDSGEGVFPRQVSGALTQGSTTAYSAVGTDGVLQAYAAPGAYSLSIGQLSARYTISQPSGGAYTGAFTGSSQLVSGQNFGIAPIVNQTDLRIALTPYSVARAGFTTRYRLTLENVGTTTVPAGTATVTLDALAQYISSSPTGTATGRVVSWSYPALAPFAQQTYDVTISLPINVPLATALTTTAAAPVAGDLEPADNAVTLPQTVVGPYDPNEIEVNYQRLTPAQVAAQQPLDYIIHFQNLGTFAASTVVVIDTLDFTKLNPANLMLVAQSHSCMWSLTSITPTTGQLTVRFLGINLPERNVDVIRSQGFVRFRIQPRATLAVGEVIPNRAGIVFDYNNPVQTNTATTTVFVTTAALGRHDAPAWEAYPNPATDAVTIAADLATGGPVRLELLDVLGRPVRQQTLMAPAGALRQTLDLRGLALGVYVLRITPPTGPATSRQIVRE